MKAAVVAAPKSSILIEEREVPKPSFGEVLIRIHACGVCHGDLDVQQGAFPYSEIANYPIVPGHEVAGVVEAVGEKVDWPRPGMRVGMPWLFSSCGHCPACLAGDQTMCGEAQITGVTKDGGYQEFMLAPARHVSELPEGLDFADAAPLLCAGLTVYTGLRKAGFRAGDKVAVVGLGGLGHLGVLYARAMGGRVAVVSTHPDKEEEARALGAERFLAETTGSVADALKEWDGGADVILATAPSGRLMSAAFPGLAAHGALVVLGVALDEISLAPLDLVLGERRVVGSLVGSRDDIRQALGLAVTHGIRPRLTRFPLEAAGEAIARMREGGLHGRGVLVMDAS